MAPKPDPNLVFDDNFPISKKGTGIVLWRDLLNFVADDAQIKQRFLSARDVKAVARAFFRKVSRLLQENIRGISIPNFGRLILRKRNGSYATHPITGERVYRPAQKWITIKPSDSLRRRLDKREQQRFQQGAKVRAMQKKVGRKGPWNVGAWDKEAVKKVRIMGRGTTNKKVYTDEN